MSTDDVNDASVPCAKCACDGCVYETNIEGRFFESSIVVGDEMLKIAEMREKCRCLLPVNNGVFLRGQRASVAAVCKLRTLIAKPEQFPSVTEN